MICELGDVNQDQRGEDVISSDMIRRRLCGEGVEDILRKAGGKMRRHVVGIVSVGTRFTLYHARFTLYHKDAGLAAGPG